MSEHTKGPAGRKCSHTVSQEWRAFAGPCVVCLREERDAKALLVDELVAALTKAREDICWMLNQRKFLNADCFDYLHAVLAKHTRPT